jgi:hypothetical protein
MRSRLAVLIAIGLLAGVVAAAAVASKTEAGASYSQRFTGSTAGGSVKFFFTDKDTIHHHHGGRITTTNKLTVSDFRVTDGCNRRGSTQPRSSTVTTAGRFRLRDGTFTVTGRTVGDTYQPKRIKVSIRDSKPYCDTRVLAITAKPSD